MLNFVYRLFAAIFLISGLVACSRNEPENETTYSDPYRLTAERCRELFPPDSDLWALTQAGNADVIRCTMTVHRGRQHYDPLQDLYLLYRIEGIEPEGLDERIRALDRREIATKIGNWHDLNDFLEPIEDRNWRGCLKFDPVARELITRGRDPDVPHEFDDCLPK